MSLHPNCQVLNHAAIRVSINPRINFLKKYSDKKFINFLKFAVYASLHGRRGRFGGGIFHAHAFDHEPMKNKYYKRYSSNLKSEINCLFWKDSLRVSNMIRKNGIDDILKNNSKIKFLLPVRNYLNCAKSNLKTGYHKVFKEEVNNTEECVEAIFKEFHYFLQMKDKYPDRFLVFFEDEFIDKLPDIASFLDLEKEKKWMDDAAEVIKIKSKYNNEEDLKNRGIELANKYFENYPYFKKHLIKTIKK